MPRAIEHRDLETRDLVIEARAVDQANRTITARFMSGEMDRHGTVIPPSSIRKTLKEFLRNPVVLAAHDDRGYAHAPVIGRVLSIEVKDDAAEATIQFASTTAAEEYWTLYRDGFMRGFSIGFRVVKRARVPRADGTGEYERYDEIELLEISCVAIPSNKSALALRSIEDALTRDAAALPEGQRAFGARVVEWMRGADERADALRERLDLAERELANAVEANRDLSEEVCEMRSTLDALIATTGSTPRPAPGWGAPNHPAPPRARRVI